MLGSTGLHGIEMDGAVLYASLRHCCSWLAAGGRRHYTDSHESWLCDGWPHCWLAAYSKSWEFLPVGYLGPSRRFQDMLT